MPDLPTLEAAARAAAERMSPEEAAADTGEAQAMRLAIAAPRLLLALIAELRAAEAALKLRSLTNIRTGSVDGTSCPCCRRYTLSFDDIVHEEGCPYAAWLAARAKREEVLGG